MEQITNIVGAYYAKTHFSELLDRLEAGERYLITRNNKPICVFNPIADDEFQQQKILAKEAGKELRQIRKGIRLGKDISIRDLINEGRKY